MNASAEAADQIVRISLNATETALKITGKGAEEMATLLYKMLKDMANEKNKSKGQMRLSNLLKSGKKLCIYKIDDKNLKKFCTEAKKYGITYTVLKDRKNKDGNTEIIVKAEDKQRLDYVYEKLNLTPFEDVATITEDEAEPVAQAPPETSPADRFYDALTDKPQNPTREEDPPREPTKKKKKEKSNPSANISKEKDAAGEGSDRPSVRQRLAELREIQEGGSKPVETVPPAKSSSRKSNKSAKKKPDKTR